MNRAGDGFAMGGSRSEVAPERGAQHIIGSSTIIDVSFSRLDAGLARRKTAPSGPMHRTFVLATSRFEE